MDKYILEGKTPKKVDLMTWAKWFETADRHVAQDFVGDVKVSTVFLGIDHNMLPGVGLSPTLFETMVFDGPLDGEMWRYCTWGEAEAGHKDMVERVKKAMQSQKVD